MYKESTTKTDSLDSLDRFALFFDSSFELTLFGDRNGA